MHVYTPMPRVRPPPGQVLPYRPPEVLSALQPSPWLSRLSVIDDRVLVAIEYLFAMITRTRATHASDLLVLAITALLERLCRSVGYKNVYFTKI